MCLSSMHIEVQCMNHSLHALICIELHPPTQSIHLDRAHLWLWALFCMQRYIEAQALGWLPHSTGCNLDILGLCINRTLAFLTEKEGTFCLFAIIIWKLVPSKVTRYTEPNPFSHQDVTQHIRVQIYSSAYLLC